MWQNSSSWKQQYHIKIVLIIKQEQTKFG